MNCPKCKEPLTFVNTDKTNALVGHWKCLNESCKNGGEKTT